MQAFGNVATLPERKVTKAKKVYWQFRVAESSKGKDDDPTYYTVRLFKEEDPQLAKGDFVRFMAKLKVDVYGSFEPNKMVRIGDVKVGLVAMAKSVTKLAKNTVEGPDDDDSPTPAPRAPAPSPAPQAAAPKADTPVLANTAEDDENPWAAMCR